MRQNLSTTTSAPTDIGDGESYFFMSEGLESSLGLGLIPSDRSKLNLKFNDQQLRLDLLEVAVGDDGSTICQAEFVVGFERLVKALISRETIELTLVGQEFKCQVWKVESDRCYLKLLR